MKTIKDNFNFRSNKVVYSQGDTLFQNSLHTHAQTIRGLKVFLKPATRQIFNTPSGHPKNWIVTTSRGTVIAKVNYEADFKNLVRLANNLTLANSKWNCDIIQDRHIELVGNFIRLNKEDAIKLADYNYQEPTISSIGNKRATNQLTTKKQDVKRLARIKVLTRALARKTLKGADLITYSDELKQLLAKV